MTAASSLRDRARWSNWARNQTCAPAEIRRPATEADLAEVVKQAAASGQRVKAIGAGHSFTSIACTDGVLVDLSGYGQVLAHDAATGRVTVEAGIPLHRLSDELDARGLALENLGDIDRQSVAGATQTATHGTGLRYRNLSSQIVGLRLVTGDGSVVEATAPDAGNENPDVFAAARAGLGALGLVSTVTLQCVPAFRLHAVEEPVPVDDVLADLDALVEENDHYEFYWVPHTRWALTKRNARTAEAPRPRPRVREWVDDMALNNYAFGVLCRAGRWRPSLIPRLAKIIPNTGRLDYVDRSDRVFTSPRTVKFYEMEYAIPRAALPEALNRVRRLVDEIGMRISFPVEVRVVAPDDIPLSTAYGRETGYIAVHVYQGTPYDAYFSGVERIMDSYEGRPHWGKMHFQRSETLAPRYPRWDDFQQVRARLDPEGRFANPYLDRVLGPVVSSA
ncbi:MAG TPA: D-arabinono-1,4-lactone oxidase [Acidimicrobiales bacterium]|nr:D-arabinono-1,4-lactone oxidase [Acidimicrobiales bacterium]